MADSNKQTGGAGSDGSSKPTPPQKGETIEFIARSNIVSSTFENGEVNDGEKFSWKVSTKAEKDEVRRWLDEGICELADGQDWPSFLKKGGGDSESK